MSGISDKSKCEPMPRALGGTLDTPTSLTTQSVSHLASIDNVLSEESRKNLFDAWQKGQLYIQLRSKASSANNCRITNHAVSPADVLHIANVVESQLQGKTSRSVTSRVRPFVRGLDAYGKALQVYANAAPLVMAPLWGSAQVIISIASDVIEAFDGLLDMLQDIAENLPRFEQYASVFEGRATFKAALSLVYEDVSRFLIQGIHFFCRRGISLLWRSLWKPFQEESGHIIHQLKKHITLVDNEAGLASFQQHQETQKAMFDKVDRHITETLTYRRDTMMSHQRETDILRGLQLREVTKWLCPVMPQADLDRAQRKLHPSTGSWLLNLSCFQAWILAPKDQVLPILWVHGVPGCGKTILAAKIINHINGLLQNRTNGSDSFMVSYFFCDFKDSKKSSRLAVAKSLVSQILAANPDLFPLAVTAMNESGEKKITSAPRCFSLAKDLLKTFGDNFIVIDAIDECSTEERGLLLDQLNDLASSSTTTKIIILSRQEPDIKKSLASFPSYAISSQDTTQDITRYLSDSLVKPGSFKFSMRQPLQASLQQRLSDGASGNFLWVRLMVDQLMSQPFDNFEQVNEAVTNLPLGLGAIYGRVLLQLRQAPPHIQELLISTLHILIAAYRPFTLLELSQAHSFLKETGIAWQAENLQTMISEGCGSLVSCKDDGTITLTHKAVIDFLTSPTELWTGDNQLISGFRVDLCLAHKRLSTCCLEILRNARYVVDGNNVQNVDGYDGLYAYASEFWAGHVSTSKSPNHDLAQLVKAFLQSDQAVWWLKQRMQVQVDPAVIIGRLNVLEYELKAWSEMYSSWDVQELTTNCVFRLYDVWHRRLVARSQEVSPEVLESSSILGRILVSKGNYSAAAKLYQANIEKASETLPNNHPEKSSNNHLDILRNVEGLAGVRCLQGRWVEAISLLRRAVVEREEVLGFPDRETLTSLQQLGGAIVKSITHDKDQSPEDLLKEAETFLVRSSDGRSQLLGAEHPDCLDSWLELARLFVAQKRYKDAEDTFKKHQELTQRLLGKEHRHYLHSLDDLGDLYQKIGRYKDAEGIYEEVWKQRRRVLGDHHPDNANSIWSIGVLQQEQSRFDEAISTFALLEPFNEKTHGASHRYTIKPLARMAEMHVALGNDAAAQPLLERIVVNCDYTSSASVEVTKKSSAMLVGLYERTGKSKKAKSLGKRTWTTGKPPPKPTGVISMIKSKVPSWGLQVMMLKIILGFLVIWALGWRWFCP